MARSIEPRPRYSCGEARYLAGAGHSGQRRYGFGGAVLAGLVCNRKETVFSRYLCEDRPLRRLHAGQRLGRA